MKWSINGTQGIVCCPSYRRPDQVETLKLFPSVRVYVAEKEYGLYKYHNQKAARNRQIVAMPDNVQGNIARVRNWILDQHKNEAVCIIDDDLMYLAQWRGDQAYRVENEAELVAILQKYTLMAMELGTPLWGMNVNLDKQCYREYSPFSLTSVVLAPFMVHVKTPHRFDESIPLKEDYDFCLQTLNENRKILRVNSYHYLSRQGCNKTSAGQTGGCAASRSVAEEHRQLALLQKKWGSTIVKVDSLDKSQSHKSEKRKAFDINPIIRVPIMGI